MSRPSVLITGSDPTPNVFKLPDQPVCGICQVQFSRYTCPHCNLHYCSLTCFRSDQHSNCSETFDRKSLLTEISSNTGKSEEEKKAMLEMLRRFEEEAKDDDDEAESEGEEDEEEGAEERRRLEEALEGVDLGKDCEVCPRESILVDDLSRTTDALTPTELLSFLSPAQLSAFTSTLNDPTKLSRLVSEEFQGEAPWWESVLLPTEIKEVDDEEEMGERPELVHEADLPMLRVGENGKALASSQLIYNIISVLFAYSYTLRTFSLTSFQKLPVESTERITIVRMLSQLLPFLFEKSTVLLAGIGEGVEYVVSRESVCYPLFIQAGDARIDQSCFNNKQAINPELLPLLLTDVAALLTPASISSLSSNSTSLSSHPAITTLTALSDIYFLLTSIAPAPSSKKALITRPSTSTSISSSPSPISTKNASAKILYYISFLHSPFSPMKTDELLNLSERIGDEADKRREESEEVGKAIRGRKETREREINTPKEEQGIEKGMSSGKIVMMD